MPAKLEVYAAPAQKAQRNVDRTAPKPDHARVSEARTPGESRRTAIAAAWFLGIGLVVFPGAGWDDAYITYWSAHALATLGEIVNYNGDRIEQSSSLGQVLTLALLHRFTGIEISILGHVTSVLFGLLTVLATARLARLASPHSGARAPILVATSAYFLYWSFSGMETSLAALAAVLLLQACARVATGPPSLAAVSRLFGAALLYLLARPETTYVVAATLAGTIALHVLQALRHRGTTTFGRTLAPWLLVAIVVALAATTIVGFRLGYFGSAFPQPVSAKVRSVSSYGLTLGLGYLARISASDFALLLVLAIACALRTALARAPLSAHHTALQLCGMFLGAHLAFAVASGGDFMPGARFLVPSIPAAAVLGVHALHGLARGRAMRWAMPAWVVLQLGGVVLFASVDSRSNPIWVDAEPAPPGHHWIEQANHDHRRYLEVVPALDALLDEVQTAGGERPVLFSGQCGFVMYYTFRDRFGRLRLLDRFGITAPDFLDCGATAGIPRARAGLQMGIAQYLSLLGPLEAECGIPRPDVIFDLFWQSDFPEEYREGLDRAGYDLAYMQPVPPPNLSTLLPGRHVTGRAFFAVRRSLLEGR